MDHADHIAQRLRNESKLTALRVREVLVYVPESGLITRDGKACGWIEKITGYLRMSIDGTTYKAHRLAWLYVYGCWPAKDVDHVNGIRHDNRLCNLREATRSENVQNQHRPQKNNKTGITGICLDKRKRRYVVQVKLNGKMAFTKRFDKLEDAIAANNAARAKLHPFAPPTASITALGSAPQDVSQSHPPASPARSRRS